MPIIETKGAASSQGFGEFTTVSAPPNYIEDVFSTYLYTGNGSTQTINNGIDLAGKGGLVWIKSRSSAYNHGIWDTLRGAGTSVGDARLLSSNTTTGQYGATSPGTAIPDYLSVFGSSGFSVTAGGGTSSYQVANASANNYASWTFRKQPKFFDVVTYTGTGSARTVAHNLGSVPGCIITKRVNNSSNWAVYHVGMGNTKTMFLNSTLDSGSFVGAMYWNNTSPTSTQFTVGYDASTNASGDTYVAYLFAHNAGGFGLTGTDNVISCGSFNTNSGGDSAAQISLGYEPQWVLVKAANTTGDWVLFDNMRGISTGVSYALIANLSNAEVANAGGLTLSATGFTAYSMPANAQMIYIAIRRGPMKVPTDGTKVFAPVTYTGNNTDRTVSAPFVTDLAIVKSRDASVSAGATWGDRLRGQAALDSSSTGAEFSAASVFQANPWDVQGGVKIGSGANATNNSGTTYIDWMFRRAPGFFDEVCYTGTGAATTFNHNLGVVPEMMIVKRRSAIAQWNIYTAATGNGSNLVLNSTAAVDVTTNWNSTTPTNSVFYLSGGSNVNGVGATYVAYLFASCPGVSKVGSYTGNGSTQTINCGFTGGARFVLIKRTDSTGDWYVYDTARGMTTLTDPYLLLNSTAAESATLGSVTTVTTGFAVNASILAAINTNAASYIFWAVA